MENTREIEQRYNELTKQYSSLSDTYKEQSKVVSQKIIKSSWVRVFIFVLLFTAPFYVYDYSAIASFGIAIGFLIAFGVLVKRSIRYRRQKEELQLLQKLNNNEIKALEGDWSCFNSGEEFINPQHDFSHDLDLFGTGSFFQYINRTSTLEGTIFLKNKISTPFVESAKIIEEQDSLKELSNKLDFRQYFYAKGKILEETNEDIRKIKAFNTYEPLIKSKSKFFKILIKSLPYLLLTTLVLTFWGLPAGIPSALFLFNLVLIGSNIKTLNKINNQFSSLTGILKKYALLTDLINNEKFDTSKLTELQLRLKSNTLNASEVIQKLSHYMGQFDQRNGIVGGILLNGFLLWDFKYVAKIEQWLQSHKGNMEQWINVVHEIDAMCSMAGYVYNHPDFIFPTPDDNSILNAEELGHPLLNRTERICNDYDFKESIFSLITGANMSGKSTFLRTVGLNLVIARCGMSVCAQTMAFKPMVMITNMRTTDSLMKHESYFYAELKRLQYIIKQLKSGDNVFIILDEILKGTNSKDKTYGSMELIKHLLSINAYGMIATHDLELGILESETNGKIVNQCFEVENRDNKLHFDYKLQYGVTQNHNATFLMKRMGIILDKLSTIENNKR